MILDINGSFEQGWDDLPPTGNAGYLVNQKPKKWTLEILPPGAKLWDSDDEVKGEPECVHKLSTQLPERERLGGTDALILDGNVVYKIFHSGATFGAKLSQTITGLKPGSEATITVPIRSHRPKSDGDTYEAEFRLVTNGLGGWWNATELPHRKWVYRTQKRLIDDSGELTIEIYVKSKWPRPVDFFIDNVIVKGELDDSSPPTDPPPVEPPDEPSDDIETRIANLEEGLHQAIVSLQTQGEAIATLNNAVQTIIETLKDIMGGNTSSPVYGIDVSRYQGQSVNFPTARNNAEFCIIRAGSGRTPKDANLDYQYQQAITNNMRVGLYWYLYPENPESQAFTFANHCERLSGVKFAFIDVEQDGLTADIVQRFVNAFESISPFKQKIGIYTRASFWDNLTGEKTWATQHDLWVAWYTSGTEFKLPQGMGPALPNEWAAYKIWQFSSLGGGFFGQTFNSLDSNVFNGNVFAYGERKSISQPDKIDLVKYMMGDGRIFEMKHNSGQQERQQDQPHETGWYRVKGENQGVYEKWVYDDTWIYLELDTSPAPADDGAKRYYRIIGNNNLLAPKMPRHMSVGEEYIGGNHYVQFYKKSNCFPHDQNSGWATNKTKLVSKSPRTINGMTFSDVVEIVFNGEVDFYAKGYGRIYHYATHDGEWQIAEAFAPGQRPDIKREVIGCLER